LYGDVFHGTSNFITSFRNYWIGNQPACWQGGSTYANAAWGPCNNNQTPIALYSFQRFHNIIGNVLGQPGIQTVYSGTGSRSIYITGNGNSLNNDPNVALTLMRWGNYDVVNTNVRFVDSEVPSTL